MIITCNYMKDGCNVQGMNAGTEGILRAFLEMQFATFYRYLTACNYRRLAYLHSTVRSTCIFMGCTLMMLETSHL